MPDQFSNPANPEIHRHLDRLFQDFRDYYTRHGQPVDENPSPGNKAGGITTLEVVNQPNGWSWEAAYFALIAVETP